MSGRTLLGLLALVVLGLLAWELRWVLLVLFGAVVLAVALDVPVSWLRRFTKLNRPTALVVVVALLLVGGWKLGELLLPELLEQAHQLTLLVPVLIQRVSELLGGVAMLKSLEQQLMGFATWDKLQPLGAQVLGFAGGAANGTIQLLLMVLLALLLALDPRSHQRLVLATTPNHVRPLAAELLRDCREALGGWLAGMTISATAVFLFTWAGLAALKVPLALLSALACGLLTFVPTIGPTVATLLPLAVALLVSPALALQVLILRLVLQNGEAFLLTPILLSRTVNLLPTVALMAQLSLGALLGLPGVLLALPLVVVLQVLAQKVLVEQIMDRW
ncbi:MAG: AI-2E family transporter [Synechococcaceae bacterium WB8_1B_136]|nr:AI-2E family transporter [Synechococcaceae bacterium WB8_1B_136]